MFPDGQLVGFAVALVGLYATAFVTGTIALRWRVRVNYTRKINHFVIFALPLVTGGLAAYERTTASASATSLVVLSSLVLFARPFRERVPVLRTMFAGYDRPEDRPYTLRWLSTQIVAGYLVLVPLAAAFTALGKAWLVAIPFLINGIGDGLAEPVGVRFGRHAYRVRALHGGRAYVRTLEGSAVVLLIGIAVVALLRPHFTGAEFWAALFAVPLSATLAEAVSPHTWDTPFIFLASGLTLLGVVALF